jgi:hypothetical protein
VAMPVFGQYTFTERSGRRWMFMWQTLRPEWTIQQVLIAVRDKCVHSINATQSWWDTLHAIGDRKMYSVTAPKDKNVDEIAAHWVAALLELEQFKYYRALIIVKARPNEAKDEVRFVCHAAMCKRLMRMTVKMEPRIQASKPAPVWRVKDTEIVDMDADAVDHERALDPAVNLLRDCVLRLGPWDEFNLEVPRDNK